MSRAKWSTVAVIPAEPRRWWVACWNKDDGVLAREVIAWQFKAGSGGEDEDEISCDPTPVVAGGKKSRGGPWILDLVGGIGLIDVFEGSEAEAIELGREAAIAGAGELMGPGDRERFRASERLRMESKAQPDKEG